MSRSRPLIYGHRGGDGGRANSVAAIRKAADIGVDGVEIDVQLTSDDVLVAEHDPVGDGRTFSGDSFDDVLAVALETPIASAASCSESPAK